MDNNLPKIKQKNKIANGVLVLASILFLIIGLSYFLFSSPLSNKDIIVHIPYGESLDNVSLDLKGKEIIKNTFALKVFVKLFQHNGAIIDGDYLIKKSSPVYIIAWQITKGKHSINPVKVTLREGLTNEEMALVLSQKLIGFNKDLFMSQVSGKQGYLFPDTYFLFPLDTTEEIINKLSNNFSKKIKSVGLNESNNLEDIIIMASILEGEANGESDASIISGILWKRLKIGMPLQVDVAPDTYKEKGLPGGPINNPGLAFIKASANPIDSGYLYYLHDKDGNAHFAKSFEEHKININKYLK